MPSAEQCFLCCLLLQALDLYLGSRTELLLRDLPLTVESHPGRQCASNTVPGCLWRRCRRRSSRAERLSSRSL